MRLIRPTTSDWPIGFAFAALNWSTDLPAFAASCRAVSIEHPPPAVLLTYHVAEMTASSLSLLADGFGVLDLAMIVTFTSGGVAIPAATAAVIVYRVISCLLLVTLGWLAYFIYHHMRISRQSVTRSVLSRVIYTETEQFVSESLRDILTVC